MKFLTKEMNDEMMWRLETNQKYQSKLKGLSIRLILLSTDAPGNEDRQYAMSLEDGKFIDFEVQAKPAPSDLRTAPLDRTKYDARMTAPHQTLFEMVQGRQELLSGLDKLKIEGDIGKMMAQTRGFIKLALFIGSMPIEP